MWETDTQFLHLLVCFPARVCLYVLLDAHPFLLLQHSLLEVSSFQDGFLAAYTACYLNAWRSQHSVHSAAPVLVKVF